MLGATQATLIGHVAAAGGGGGYLPSAIRAWEFEESSSPAVDSINSYEAALGSAMTLSSGELHTTNTTSSVNTALTDDAEAHIGATSTRSFEWYGTVGSSGSWVVLFTVKGVSATQGHMFAASKLGSQYDQFFFGNSTDRSQFNDSGGGYVTDEVYHFVLVVDGEGHTTNSTLFINGIKYVGSVLSNLPPSDNVNSFGFNSSATGAEINARYYRVYDKLLSDAEAAQLYADRDVAP